MAKFELKKYRVQISTVVTQFVTVEASGVRDAEFRAADKERQELSAKIDGPHQLTVTSAKVVKE
jgi:hypothetical protein